jgi:hypothetical protein
LSNPNFDSLVATTLKLYSPTLHDNVTEHQALFFLLKEKGFQEERDGGETIVEPLLTGENSTVSSYSGYDIIDTTPQDNITAAEFNWKQIAGSVSISGDEEFKNSSSRAKVISLLEGKIKDLEIALELDLNEQIYSDGTGNGGKDITGLALAVENGAAWSSYGGIDSNANTYWRNTWLAEAGALDLASMRNVFNSASRGNSKPELIVTTQSVFEDYEALALANNEISRPDNRLGDAGFVNLTFKMVPMVFDEDCTSGAMYFLNPSFMKWIVGRGRNFVATPFQRPKDQDAKVSQILLYAQLLLTNRKRQGVLDGIT